MEFNEIISSMYKDEKYKDIILKIMENEKIIFLEDKGRFSKLDRYEMSSISKMLRMDSLSNLTQLINSSRIIEESCRLRRDSGIPFVSPKRVSFDMPSKESFFTIHPSEVKTLDKGLRELNRNISIIKDDYKELRCLYNYCQISKERYKREFPEFKRRLAEHISNQTNFIIESSSSLFCGLIISDIASSLSSIFSNLRDENSNRIHFNTSSLDDAKRAVALDSNLSPESRRIKYAELIYHEDNDKFDNNGSLDEGPK